MCHVHRIWYSCFHGDLVLHSKCRATRIKITRKKSTNLPYNEGYAWTPVYTKQDTPYYQVAACKAHATLEINLKTRCGPCRFSAVKRKWDKEMAKTREGGTMMGVRCGVVLSELLEKLRMEREKEEWECRKMYPPEGKKAPITKPAVRTRIEGPSPLRHEIQPEDIDDVEDVDWNKLLDDFDKPMVETDIDGGTFMDFFEDQYGFWGPNVDFNKSDFSSLQISNIETKDESLNDNGYSSAEPDDETGQKVVWDFEPHQVPAFEMELNNGEKVDTKDEGLFNSELGGFCTFAEMNDKVSEILTLSPNAKLEVMAW